ncbi:MAG: hypothetical protein Q8P77_01090 [Candidatus Veblenbacteria bacterium]|nr:hypothetical protein [Candidatus Veblenbacteria bacterium]
MEKQLLTMDNDTMSYPYLTPKFFGEAVTPTLVKIFCHLFLLHNHNDAHSKEYIRPKLVEIAGKITGLDWREAASAIEGVASLSPFVTKTWLDVLNDLFNGANPGDPSSVEFQKGAVIGLFNIAMLSRDYSKWSEINELQELFINLLKSVCTYDEPERGLTVSSVRDDKEFMNALKKTIRGDFVKNCTLFKNSSTCFEQFSESIGENEESNLVGEEVFDIIGYTYLAGLTDKERLGIVLRVILQRRK